MRMYALHDKKSKSFSSYHAAKTDAVASRDFAQAVLEPKSILGKYPEDFELVVFATLFEEVTERDMVCAVFPYEVVLTARQVLDLKSAEA